MKPYNGKTHKAMSYNGHTVSVYRVEAEKVLGRPLRPPEEIHHLEGGLTGPIVICPDRAYHKLLHVRMRALKATGNANYRQCQYCHRWDDKSLMYKRPKGEQYYHNACRAEYQNKRYVKLGPPDFEGEKNPFYGKLHTEETKEKMREAKRRFYERRT